MQKLTYLLFFLLLIKTSDAQLACPEQYRMRIIAQSGLNMRTEPRLKSRVVTTVPYDSSLLACKNTEGSLTVDGITGYWRKATYRGAVGYMFDGFMEVVEVNPQMPKLKWDSSKTITATDTPAPVKKSETAEEKGSTYKFKPRQFQFLTEAYNYCGDVEKIDPGLLWYGIYPADAEQGEVYYRIQPVELEVVLSRSKVGDSGMEFDIQTDRDERSIFLIGTNRLLGHDTLSIEDNDQQLRYTGRRIFPGQQLSLGNGKDALKLSATGSVTKPGDCPELKNYKLSVSQGENSQDLTKLLTMGDCGMPEIFWYGDLSGDGTPEIIFVSQFEEKNNFTLLLSREPKKGQLLRTEAEWIVEKCY